MNFWLIRNRLSAFLIRSSLAVRISLTFLISTLLFLAWWWAAQARIFGLNRDLELKIKQLSSKLAAKPRLPKMLVSDQNESIDSQVLNSSAIELHNLILNCAINSGLKLQNYKISRERAGACELNFIFTGSYLGLSNFLQNLDLLDIQIDCKKLKVVIEGTRLQIGYACGISTVV